MKITCLSTSLSPITHQLGTVGNESIVNTEDVRTPLGNRKVPVLSGNAIRHRMLRSPGAEYLEEVLDLSGELTRDQLNLLYHGGLKREKAKRPSLARIADMQRLFPLLRLLGVCLPEAIVSGEIKSHRAMLVCRENQTRIEAMVPDDWRDDIPRLAPATSFVERWQYVRGKLTHAKAADTPDESDDDDSKMMPFAGTCVVPNSCWLHGFWWPDYDDETQLLLFGCVLSCIRKWASDGASIGGQSSRGHGFLAVSMHVDSYLDPDEAVNTYEQHVLANREECRDFLLGCYA